MYIPECNLCRLTIFPYLSLILVGLIAGVPCLLLGTRRHHAEKDQPFECGFEEFENVRMKFDVRYCLMAILFILFDLEAEFMIPWAEVFKDLLAQLRKFAFWSMFVFIAVFGVGFVYEWKKRSTGMGAECILN